MDLLHLVDRIEELLATAQKMPIGNRAIIDRRRMLDIIDQMRIAIPHEVREAQDIVARRDHVLREAEEDRRLIEAQAQERASRMVESHEISQAARARAEEIAREAERRLQDRIDEANQDISQRIDESRSIAREQMRAADEYARDLLERLERQLGTFVKSVRAGIDQLEPTPQSIARSVPRTEIREAPVREMAPPPVEHEPERFVERPADRMPERAPERLAERDEPEDYDDRLDRLEQERFERERLEPTPPPAMARFDRAPIPFPRDEAEEGLENLLQPRRTRPAPSRDTSEPGIIDDFANEPLDDDPMFRRARHDDDDR
ncbi:MAG: hypothetical protein DWI58_08285 [Chloroflexi bacterium]|nr:MAG: hypothetical protein DWI58_08285 [Chloroflexota bacterium]